jgi:hypothetical protein
VLMRTRFDEGSEGDELSPPDLRQRR